MLSGPASKAFRFIHVLLTLVSAGLSLQGDTPHSTTICPGNKDCCKPSTRRCSLTLYSVAGSDQWCLRKTDGSLSGNGLNFKENLQEIAILLSLSIIMPSFKTKNCEKYFIIMKETGLSEEQTRVLQTSLTWLRVSLLNCVDEKEMSFWFKTNELTVFVTYSWRHLDLLI